MSVEEFDGLSPRFVPEEVFTNAYSGNGVFFDRFGKVRRSFVISIKGERLSESELVLREDLRFDDGESIKRSYRFLKKGPHSYEVLCDDLVGKAEVKAYGNVLHWNYVLKTKIGDDVWNLSFSDWMFLRPDGTILNRAYATKWGFDVGEVFLEVSPSQES